MVDAIDHVRAKTALIAHCRANGIAIVTIGGAGGRTDAARVRVADLAHTLQEPMLAKVRKNLRTHHGFPRDPKKAFGIPAVFSDQPLRGNEAVDGATLEGMTRSELRRFRVARVGDRGVRLRRGRACYSIASRAASDVVNGGRGPSTVASMRARPSFLAR